MEIPAHMVKKTLSKSSSEVHQDAKEYVKQNKKDLFSIQKTKKILKKKEKEVLKSKIFESEKEKKRVLKISKKIQRNKLKGKKDELNLEKVLDPWAEEDKTKFKSKWEDKPLLPELEKARNPAIMKPKSGESHNPSQGAYSKLVNSLFDKGN